MDPDDDNWECLFDEFKKEKNILMCCDKVNYNIIDGYYVCTNCGTTDFEKQEFYSNTFNCVQYRNYTPYKRIVYFKQKLNMINNILLYKHNPQLIFFIENNKNKKIKSVYKLRKIMKKLKLHKYYKYIYSIYAAITGKQLIKVRSLDYPTYICQFKNIERIFVKKGVRHNLYSYNVIIYFLLRLNNNEGYKHLILPLNKTKLKKKIKELFLLCQYDI